MHGKPAKSPYFGLKVNRLAAKENMSEEAHARRIQGLIRSWRAQAKNRERLKKGMEKQKDLNKQRTKASRPIVKIHLTTAREAREIQELARQSATAAMQRLIQIVASAGTNDAAAIAAAQVILDRAYGKASQVNVNAHLDANGKPSEISSKELDTRINEALKRVETITRGAPEAPKSKERPADLRERDRDTGGATKH